MIFQMREYAKTCPLLFVGKKKDQGNKLGATLVMEALRIIWKLPVCRDIFDCSA